MSISVDVSSLKYRISRHIGQGFLDTESERNQQFLDPHGVELLYHAKMEIKDWIKAARKHAGLTQDQLGDRMSLTKGNISAWENGRHEASFGQLQQIANITGYALQHGAAEQNPSAQSEPAVVAELAAIAEISAIYARSNPEQRRRILTAVRDVERMGVVNRAVANNKPE